MTALTAPVVDPADVYVPVLDGADLDLLRTMLHQWSTKVRRNLLRVAYYDGKNRLRDLGISIPPQLKSVETVVGWPAKGVDALAHRTVFDGFVLPGAEQDPYGVTDVWVTNRMDVELPQAVTSMLIHSVAFVSATHGDVQAGEPEVLLQSRSALYGTGLWNRRTRSLSAAMSISDVDEDGVPTEIVMHLPDRVGVLARSAGGRWSVVWRRNPVGRVLVEPLVYRPDLDRPFGRSRITRAVMSITDEAVRTVLRTETSAEFFAAPQRALLGADEWPFMDSSGNPIPAWQANLGRIWTIGRDEEGNVPKLEQLPQESMQPHTEMLRMEASRFAGETNLPLSSLGVVQDNPSSAEAIYAAKEDLVIEAADAGRAASGALIRLAQAAVMLRDGLTEVPEDLRRLQAQWANPATPSVVSAADAVVKQVAAVPWLAESPVILERMGYDQATITRLLADKARAEGQATLRDLMAQGRVAQAAAAQATPANGGVTPQ